MATRKNDGLTASNFIALPDSQKQRIIDEIESKTPEQRWTQARPLSPAQKKRFQAMKKKMGRPKVGQGSQAIALTVEKALLKRATAYAKAHGMKRTELFARGLKLAMGEVA